jgi:hypothetical protein
LALFVLRDIHLRFQCRGREVGGSDDDWGVADWTVDVGTEPCVDAGPVEWVRAAREEADKLPVTELAESHRAVPSTPHVAAVLHGG